MVVAEEDGIRPRPRVAPFVAEIPSQAGVDVFEEGDSLPPHPHPHLLPVPDPPPAPLAVDSGLFCRVPPC